MISIATNTSLAILETSSITSSPSQSTAGTDGSNVETVTQAIEAYTSWLTSTGKASSTVRQAEQLLTAIVWEVMGCDRLDQFDADITVQFLENQVKHGYAGKTIRTYISELKRFSKFLVRSGRIKSDPIADLMFEVDEAESVERAQVRFQRLFKMIEFVSNHRFGVTPEAINKHCCETARVCERTTRRDIELLVAIGAFRKEDRASRLDATVIKLSQFSRLSQLASK